MAAFFYCTFKEYKKLIIVATVFLLVGYSLAPKACTLDVVHYEKSSKTNDQWNAKSTNVDTYLALFEEGVYDERSTIEDDGSVLHLKEE